MKKPIYLDYAATTPVDPAVVKVMLEYLTNDGIFGNSSSKTHAYGWQAEEAIERARADFATLIHAEAREVVWTSGATEADNLAIKGVAHFYKNKGKHIITCKSEHKAVLDSCAQLQDEGFEVTYLEPEKDGLIDLDKLRDAIRDDTILVSIMYVNNEIGVIQDIDAIANIVHNKGTLLHVDAVQAGGRLQINVEKTPVDLLAFSGHKVYGPKGVGALYIRRKPRVRLTPLFTGGGQEQAIRPGTLANHQIMGMAEAYKIAYRELENENQRILNLRQRLLQGISSLSDVYINGHTEKCVPQILNLSFNGIDGESLLMALHDIAISTGSACASANLSTSHVLGAIGLDDELAHSAIRISFGRYTTESDIDFAAKLIVEQVKHLRELSPIWREGRVRT